MLRVASHAARVGALPGSAPRRRACTRAALRAQAAPRPRAPFAADLRDLARTCGPTTALYVAKNTCYIVLQAAATALPPLAVAAHQPVWGVWNIGGFAHAPLEQAALAFLPAARTPADAREVVAVRGGALQSIWRA